MTISARYVTAVVLLTAASSIALGIILIRLGGQDVARAFERQLEVSAELAAQAIDDEGLRYLPRIVDEDSPIIAVAVYDSELSVLGSASRPGRGDALPSTEQLATMIGTGLADEAVQMTGDVALALVPRDTNGFVVIVLSDDLLRQDLADLRRLGLLAVVFASAVSGLIGAILVRRLARPLVALTRAAADLEDNDYDSAVLDRATGRSDEVGELARSFDRMATHVQQRQRELEKRLATLEVRIDEDQRRASVARIATVGAFADLADRAALMRRRRAGTLGRDEPATDTPAVESTNPEEAP